MSGTEITASTVRTRGAEVAALAYRLRLPLAILGALLFFATIEPRIVSAGNLGNIAEQSSYLAIFALAQCLVILTRGFDLSLGNTVSLISVLSAMTMVSTGSVALGLAAGIVGGLVVGLGNGLLVGAIRLNPLVTTLGTSYVVLAFASTISGGFPVMGMPDSFGARFAQADPLGIPAPIWIVALVFLAAWVLLRATTLGRSLYLVGANPRAAHVAGINSTRVLILAYVISAAVTAIGALLLTARTGSGEPSLGGNLTLEAIAAAVVGGVKLSGGEGGVGAALMGAVLVTVLSNGMNLIRVDGYIQQIIIGVIIILSLILSRDTSRH